MDELFIRCHICGTTVMTEKVPVDATLPPWKVIRWHERMISHIRRAHLRRQKRVRKEGHDDA